MPTITSKLIANRVSNITYRCQDIGYGIEEGTVLGYWTGEIDTWGKYTIRVIVDPIVASEFGLEEASTSPFLYLFADEIVDVQG